MPYFKRKNVSLVVRLNKPYYDAKKFTQHGIDHMDLYFLDGSNPPEPILNKFIARCEETLGAVAVHCKAGLGRTGTCIAAYLMKHYRITAEEIIGWMRVTRPGSVIGPQQHFLREIQPRMWREGELMRTRLSAQPKMLLPAVEKERTGGENVSRPGTGSSLREREKRTTTTTTTTPTTTAISASVSLSSTGSPLRAPAASPLSAGYLRPSSRGHSRPGSSLSASLSSPQQQQQQQGQGQGQIGSERDDEATQGDLLRLRRQQHLQQTAKYSLSASLSASATSSSTTSTSTPSTNSGRSALSAGAGSPVGSGRPPTISASPGAVESPSRPQSRSRLSGLLSSWKNN